jgi:hypothetical protein
MDFTSAAAELQQQEIARLRDAVVPRLEALRSMPPPQFREVIAAMWQRFGHEIITGPAMPRLVTMKGGRKFITACPASADPFAREIARLHQAAIAANAEHGFYITPNSFSAEARAYAESGTPIDLIDGKRLMKALFRSFEGVELHETYKAMCGQCGGIVQHRLGEGEARPCANGHAVVPTIARAMIIRTGAPAGDAAKPARHPYSRREIREHNYRYEARMMKRPRGR